MYVNLKLTVFNVDANSISVQQNWLWGRVAHVWYWWQWESKDRHKINEVEMLVVVAILRKMVMMFFPQLPWFTLSDRVGHTLCPYKSARWWWWWWSSSSSSYWTTYRLNPNDNNNQQSTNEEDDDDACDSQCVLIWPHDLICPHMRMMMTPSVSQYVLIWGQGWGWVWLPVCPYMSARAWPTVHSLPRYLVLSSHSATISFCSICKCFCIRVIVYLCVSICMCAHTCVCFHLCCELVYMPSLSPAILSFCIPILSLCAFVRLPNLPLFAISFNFTLNNSSVILDLALFWRLLY